MLGAVGVLAGLSVGATGLADADRTDPGPGPTPTSTSDELADMVMDVIQHGFPCAGPCRSAPPH